MSRGRRERVTSEQARQKFRALAAGRARNQEPQPRPEDWEPPRLRVGGRWIGGSLRREEIYGDDGR
jgi:hypothetical protein